MKRFGWAVFIFFFLYFIFLIRQDIINNIELKHEKQAASRNLNQEEKLAGGLQTRLKDLNGENYVEQLARTRLGMIKKGETAYKIIKDK
ncbi:septum formation initiator family protein [Candidatus Saganbacteria bacterium]|nr:septum formation initiator family protein [Candidatus Saganbacteria bacterium]